MEEIRSNTYEEVFELQKVLILGGPVTCVSFLKGASEYLVAKGPWIEIYRDNNEVKRYLILNNGGSIHGVRSIDDSTILIFGGQQIALVDKNSFEVQTVFVNEKRNFMMACDWIWDIDIVQQGDHFLLALGLANNACEVWFLDRPDGIFTAKRLYRRLCECRCITYCMSFNGWEKDTELKLASGTVFNEIILWSPAECLEGHPDQEIPTKRRPVEHKLVGHRGVILALKFNEEGNQLASASDDRSVRLWKLTLNQRQAPTWTQTWIGWGHTARVWSVCFSREGLVSTGEDGTSRLWDFQSGEQVGQMRNYSSQSIWSVDVSNDLALLGTNDGSVKLWNLRCKTTNVLQTDYPFSSTIMIPDDRPETKPKIMVEDNKAIKNTDDKIKRKKKKKKKPSIMAQVIFGMDFYQRSTNDYALAVGTRFGSLFIFSLSDFQLQETIMWHGGIEDKMVKTANASCLSISRRKVAAIGTTKGELVLRPLASVIASSAHVIDGRNFKSIQRVSWCRDDLIASFHIKGIVVLWHLSKTPSNKASLIVLNTTTSAIPVCISTLSSERGFVVGDSCGNIALFNVEKDSAEEICATSLCKKVHAKEHINHIKAFSDGRVVSVGNDGCIAECFITRENELVRGSSTPIPGVTGVLQMWYNDVCLDNLPRIVTGYFGNLFTVIDCTGNFEVFKFETGGRQRQISHLISVSPEGNLQLSRQSLAVCSNRKDGRNEVMLFSSLHSNHRIFNHAMGISLHGEPIYDACMFTTADDLDYAALVSGSEDCTAKLSFLVNDTVTTCISMPPQESCIRAVATSRKFGSSTSLLTIGGGKLSIDFYLIKDMNVAGKIFCRDLVQVHNVGRGGTHDMANIDHRINTIKAIPNPFSNEGNSSHFVGIGDSNGNVDFFIVQEERRHERFIIPKYHIATQDRPILSLDVLSWGNCFLVIAGSTAGRISIWCITVNQGAELRYTVHDSPIHEFKAHQMGTNAICTSILNNSISSLNLVICSGGDDQAISVIEVIISRGKNQEMSARTLSKTLTAEADVSALKGVQFINQTKFISVGYGQKMLMWSWSRSNGNELLGAICVDVCDVNCLAFCRMRDRAIAAAGGEGLEIIEVKKINE